MKLPHQHFMQLLRTQPRLFVAAALGGLTFALLPGLLAVPPVSRWLMAWDTGIFLYLLMATAMMSRSAHHHMRQRAQQQDENQWVILVLVVVSSVANLAAIGGELAWVKDLHGVTRTLHAVLAGATVLLSWAFIQVMFTLHYAHAYYAADGRGHSPGLQFPNDAQPHYGDFFHFASVIGTSGQTADVSFTSKSMRRLGTVHCILAYLFNTTVLALMVNIGASLF